MHNIALIGYSGHAFVVFETFFSQGQIVSVYADHEEKKNNPYALKWLGNENDDSVIERLKDYSYFVSIGDNKLRKKISEKLYGILGKPEIALHKTAIISRSIDSGYGNLFAAGVIINPQVKIGNGVICNTGSIIEHECEIGDYTHIAPGATLCGNIKVGEGSFVGANSVIKQGIKIGKNVTIGAGAVIVKNVNDNSIIVGNPQRLL